MSDPLGPVSWMVAAVRAGDFAPIVDVLSRRLGITIDAPALAHVCRGLDPPICHDDDVIVGWAKNRLSQTAAFDGLGRDPMMSARLTVVLHIGFTTVPETTDQVGRLRENGLSATPTVARSKIGKTIQVEIRPIDATAARVTSSRRRDKT